MSLTPEAAIRPTQGMLGRIAARLPTYLSDIRENPAWLPMFIFARTMPGRRLHWRFARPVVPDGARASLFENVEARDAAAALRADGIFAGLMLPDAVTDEIVRFARETPCFGNFDRRLEFLPGERVEAEARFGRPLLSGHYFERVLDCEAALAVQRDPLLHEIAALYLGGQAKLIKTRVWWSFPTGAASDAEKHMASLDKYHFDLDDWRTLKFFFYLLPVDEGTGPHVYMRGTHDRRIWKHQFTMLVGHPEHEVLTAYGRENALTLTGPAGFGFAEDPFGFHMGTVPKSSPRLMMEVGFGVSRPTRRGFHGEPVIR